jgi:hypothetical protein
MKIQHYILIAILTALMGCVAQPKKQSIAPRPTIDWNNPIETTNRVRVKIDEFTKNTKYVGPNIAIHRGLDHSPFGTQDLFIRAWITKDDKKPTFQIYVHSLAGDWRHFTSAYDSDGNSLDVTIISRDVGGCIGGGGVCTHEHLGLNISKSYLEAHIENGLRFKIRGKSGEEIHTIIGSYIEGFLSALRKQE